MNRTERQTEKNKTEKSETDRQTNRARKGNKGQDKGKTYRKSSPLI